MKNKKWYLAGLAMIAGTAIVALGSGTKPAYADIVGGQACYNDCVPECGYSYEAKMACWQYCFNSGPLPWCIGEPQLPEWWFG